RGARTARGHGTARGAARRGGAGPAGGGSGSLGRPRSRSRRRPGSHRGGGAVRPRRRRPAAHAAAVEANRMVGARPATAGIVAADLVGVSAALASGASPGAALGEVAHGPLVSVARSVRLGRTLRAEAGEVDTGDPAADLLVRALAVVEHAGAGAAGAV